MRFKHALGCAVALALAAAPLGARADNYDAKDGNGVHQSFAAKLISGILHPLHVMEGMFGTTPTPLSVGSDGTLQTHETGTANFACISGCSGGGGSLTGTVNLTPLSSLIDNAIQGFSFTRSGGARFTLNDPVSGADVSFADFRPASGNITAADVGTTTVSGMNGIPQISGTPTANSFQDWAVNAQSSAGLNISGTFVGTIQFDVSLDKGSHYVSANGLILGSATPLSASAITGPAHVSLAIPGVTNVRVRASAWTSGTATVQANFSGAPGVERIANALRLADSGGTDMSDATNHGLRMIETGGCTPFHLNSAASNNSTLVSALARTLCFVAPQNVGALNGYLKIYDTAIAPTCTSTTGLKHVYAVMAGSTTLVGGIVVPLPPAGEAYTNGVGICYVGGSTDTDNSNATTGGLIELGWRSY